MPRGASRSSTSRKLRQNRWYSQTAWTLIEAESEASTDIKEAQAHLDQNVLDRCAAEWTLQQFREAIPFEHDCRFVIVDRDTKFSEDLRKSVRAMGVRVLRTPVLRKKSIRL